MIKTTDPTYSPEQQLKDWRAGNPRCPNSNGECCPDFSCCKAQLLAPELVRARFIAADQRGREAMLPDFLRALIATTDVNVHVVGPK